MSMCNSIMNSKYSSNEICFIQIIKIVLNMYSFLISSFLQRYIFRKFVIISAFIVE